MAGGKGGGVELAAGAALGAVAVAEAAVFGVVCPLCVVGAPALIAVGAYKRLRKPRG
jgi:hypothetical protein